MGVTDDGVPPPVKNIAIGFQELVEGLRDDVREDIRDLRTELGKTEERVTARVVAVEVGQTATRHLIEDFAKGHGLEHEAEAEERRSAHGAFHEFIRKAELDQARRDGALGIARYSVELLSKNAPRLIAIIAAMGAVVGLASGSISVSVGK